MTGGYKGLQEVTGEHKGLEGVTGFQGYRGLQEVTEGLHGVTRGFKG